jgi:Ser/Thr protein kinase RdoA (MazF antagonist)
MSTPVFQLSPSYSLPRPDRLISVWLGRSEVRLGTQQILEHILPAYDLRLIGQPEALGVGGRSQVLVVNTDAGQKMIKSYKTNVKLQAVYHEHEILTFLAEVHFPAPRLTRTLDGGSVVRHDGHIYALFDYLNGYFQYNNYFFLPSQTQQLVASAGQALGALHEVTRNFMPAGYNPNGFLSGGGRRVRELTWFTDKLDWCRRIAPNLNGTASSETVAMIETYGAWIDERLHHLDERLRVAGLTQVVIHGDYGPYNLLFKHGAPVVIVDFELARLDWSLTDLSKAMTTFAWSRLGFSQRKSDAFLNAYRSVFDINDDELSYLPEVWTFLTLRRVIVCWYRYCQDGETRWVKEARNKLKLVHWIERKYGGNEW